MSTQCNRFVQNAWKKELCSNCFKPKEEHVAADEILRLNVEKASTNLKIDQLQVQVSCNPSLLSSASVENRTKRNTYEKWSQCASCVFVFTVHLCTEYALVHFRSHPALGQFARLFPSSSLGGVHGE